MSKESLRNTAKNNETEMSTAIQIGSKDGEVKDRKGAFSKFKKNFKLMTLSQSQVNGDVLETIEGERFRKETERRMGAGEKEITLDLSRAPELDEETVEALEDRRDTWKEQKGVKMTLTNLSTTQHQDLVNRGFRSHGLEMFTEERTGEALKKKVKKKGDEAAPLATAV